MLIAVVPNTNRTITLASTTGTQTARAHDGIAVAVAPSVTGAEFRSSTGEHTVRTGTGCTSHSPLRKSTGASTGCS